MSDGWVVRVVVEKIICNQNTGNIPMKAEFYGKSIAAFERKEDAVAVMEKLAEIGLLALEEAESVKK